MTDIVNPRPASDQRVVVVDPLNVLRRTNVVRMTPKLLKADERNTYAMAVVDAQTRRVAQTLEAILEQLYVMNMHLESIGQ